MDKEQKEKLVIEDSAHMLAEINKNEPEVAEALYLVIEHIHGCYSDKYQKGIETIDTKKMLYGKAGAMINTYQVARYLQRYNTNGAEKSGLLKDVLKGIHYLVFEVTRRIRNGEVQLNEPKV